MIEVCYSSVVLKVIYFDRFQVRHFLGSLETFSLLVAQLALFKSLVLLRWISTFDQQRNCLQTLSQQTAGGCE